MSLSVSEEIPWFRLQSASRSNIAWSLGNWIWKVYEYIYDKAKYPNKYPRPNPQSDFYSVTIDRLRYAADQRPIRNKQTFLALIIEVRGIGESKPLIFSSDKSVLIQSLYHGCRSHILPHKIGTWELYPFLANVDVTGEQWYEQLNDINKKTIELLWDLERITTEDDLTELSPRVFTIVWDLFGMLDMIISDELRGDPEYLLKTHQ